MSPRPRLVRLSWAVLAISLAAAPAVPAAPARAAVLDTAGARLDAIIAADVAKGFSGAVLVTRDGKPILDKAYGAIGGAPIRVDTRFWIASGAKQFVSASIMKLRDRAG